jgi:hypothetical protein
MAMRFSSNGPLLGAYVLNSLSLYCSSAGEYYPAHTVHISDFVGANGSVLLESTAVAVNPDYTLCQDV